MRDILNDLDPAKADPIRLVQAAQKTALPKRFYKDVAVAEAEDGWRVLLDGRPVRTPGRIVVALPTERAARLVADEFAKQGDTFDAVSMPVYRLVNTAIDGVASEAGAVLEDILRFASSDLICYRADAPERLVARQAEAWDPILDWVRGATGARFILAEGIVHVSQPRESIGALRIHLEKRTEPLRLAALHLMTSISGSALIALAIEAGGTDFETGWTAAHVDESWNSELWGEDFEAASRLAARKRDMAAAVALLEALSA